MTNNNSNTLFLHRLLPSQGACWVVTMFGRTITTFLTLTLLCHLIQIPSPTDPFSLIGCTLVLDALFSWSLTKISNGYQTLAMKVTEVWKDVQALVAKITSVSWYFQTLANGFRALFAFTSTKRKTKSPCCPSTKKVKTSSHPSPVTTAAADVAFSKACNDVSSFRDDLEAIGHTLLFAPDCTIQLHGVTWKLYEINVVEHLEEHLLCRLDAIHIPKNALYLLAYRKTLVEWIEETLVDQWMIRFPVAAPLTKPTKTQPTKSKTAKKTKASVVTPSKKSKRLAAKARAKQWAEKTYGK